MSDVSADIDLADVIAEQLCGRLSPKAWIEQHLNRQVFSPNQEAIINAIFDDDIHKVLSLQARQSGKTEAYALGILADIQLSEGDEQWIVYGPKEGQAFIILDRIKSLCDKNQDRLHKKVVDYKRRDPLGTGLLEFSDGSSVRALSASPTASVEGYSGSRLVFDEVHRMDPDIVNGRILPVAGASCGKIFMNGIMVSSPLVDDALGDPFVHKIIYDWTECPWLLSDKRGKKRLGVTYTLVPLEDGKIVERSIFVLERMPRIIKQELYPHNPEVEYRGSVINIWDLGPGDMSPDEFRANYMMKRALADDTYLSVGEFENLKSGTHDILLKGIDGEIYFAGVDCAGSGIDSDYTVISIGRLRDSGVVEKVYCEEIHGMEYEDQYDVIASLCAEKGGRFKCRLVCVDMTGVGMPVVSSLRRRMGHTVVGVVFTQTYKDKIGRKSIYSGKNLKNAMYEFAKLVGCGEGKFKYPNLDKPVSGAELQRQVMLMDRGLEQWRKLIFKSFPSRPNKQIHAPRGYSDDITDADVMMFWAACGKVTAYNCAFPMPRMVSTNYGRTGVSPAPIFVPRLA